MAIYILGGWFMKKPTTLKRAAVSLLLMAAALNVWAGGKKDSGGPGALKDLDTSKRVELVMYFIGDRPAKQDEIDANLNRLLLEKLNCTLKINWLGWGEFQTKYPLLFSSGEVFDMAYTATWLGFVNMAQRGAFMNLDQLFPKYAPKNYARQTKTALQQATIAGHIYCVPTLLGTYTSYGVIYRTDLAQPYGWDGKMANFDDVEKYLDIIKKNYPQMEPLDVYTQGPDIHLIWFPFQGDVEFFKGTDFVFYNPQSDNPRLTTYYDYPKTPQFLSMMDRWNKKGFYPKSALSDTDKSKYDNGKAALRIYNLDAYEANYRAHPEWGTKYVNFVADVAYLPFTQDALAIPASSRNPERALALYDLITSDPEVFRAFYYGIEGKSYRIIREGGQEYVEAINTDDYAFSNAWGARTPGLFLPAAGAPPDLNVFKSEWDGHIKDGAGAQRYQSFVLDTSPVETEYAACQAVHQQYWGPLELAYVDVVSGLEEYKTRIKAAGIDKVIAEFQKQLDAYVAAQKK
jgi:putative aldouronate transport system substrate-binding protein